MAVFKWILVLCLIYAFIDGAATDACGEGKLCSDCTAHTPGTPKSGAEWEGIDSGITDPGKCSSTDGEFCRAAADGTPVCMKKAKDPNTAGCPVDSACYKLDCTNPPVADVDYAEVDIKLRHEHCASGKCELKGKHLVCVAGDTHEKTTPKEGESTAATTEATDSALSMPFSSFFFFFFFSFR